VGSRVEALRKTKTETGDGERGARRGIRREGGERCAGFPRSGKVVCRAR
jgi:hypothetical protein